MCYLSIGAERLGAFVTVSANMCFYITLTELAGRFYCVDPMDAFAI